MAAIDRRDFVKGAAVLGATAVMTGISGCASSHDIQPPQFPGQAYMEDKQSQLEAAQAEAEKNGIDTTPRGHVSTANSTPGGSPVYYTEDISAEGLLAVFEALEWQPVGKVAVKLNMGEWGNQNFLDPELLKPLVEEVDGTFADSTALFYSRTTAEGYRDVAEKHGYTYAPVDILDEEGGIDLPVSGGMQIESVEVGSHYLDYGSVVSAAHFKGHRMAGFGATFTNIGMGFATYNAKMTLHGPVFEAGEPFLSRLTEYAKGVFDDLGPNIACVNVLNNLSVDCDCEANASKPVMADIGIMASLDPVALDRASLDQIYLSEDRGAIMMKSRIESLDGAFLLDYAEKLGLGSQTYELVAV